MLETRLWIKQFRVDRQLTQQEIAERLGYSHSYISKLESGSIPLNNKFLAKFRYVFDVKEFNAPHHNKVPEQLFQNLYLSLSQRNKQKSEYLLSELQRLLPISQAAQVSFLFRLYRFYHTTLELNITEAKKLLPQISKNALQLTSTGLFLFYKSLAHHYIQTDQLLSAHKAMEQATKHKEGEDMEYHLFFAMLYSKLHFISESNKHIEKANQLLQNDFQIANMLQIRVITAINLLKTHKYEQAKEEFNHILDSPYHKDYMVKTELIYYYLAKIHYAQNNYEEAIRLLRSAKVSEKETHFTVKYLYLTAKIFWKLNRERNALDYIRTIKKLASNQKYQYKTLLLELEIHNQLYTSNTIQLLLNKIIPYFKDNADLHEKYKCYGLLQDICYRMRMYKQSADYLKQMVLIKEKTSNYILKK